MKQRNTINLFSSSRIASPNEIRAIPSSKPTSTHIANQYFDHWLVPYAIPPYSITDNGASFPLKVFAMLCTLFGNKHLTTKMYHPQTSYQIIRYKKPFVSVLRNYDAEHQKNWHTFVQPLTYVYKAQVATEPTEPRIASSLVAYHLDTHFYASTTSFQQKSMVKHPGRYYAWDWNLAIAQYARKWMLNLRNYREDMSTITIMLYRKHQHLSIMTWYSLLDRTLSNKG